MVAVADWSGSVIEFPVVVLHWNPVAREYEETGRFHRFVRPLWRPQLSTFCKSLTGIDQSVIDQAPLWPTVLWELFNWLNAEGLLEQRSRHDPPDKYRLAEGVCWVTHGPEDLSGFVPKQSWIAAQSLVFAFPGFGMRASRGLPPLWLRGPLLDIRKAFCLLTRLSGKDGGLTADAAHGRHLRRDVTIAGILRQLGMEFEGRQHSGICDAHNLARILVEMARCVRDGISSERSIPEAHTGDQDGSVDVSALATALDGTHLVPSSQLPENSELTSSDVSLYTPAPDLQPDVSRTPRLYIPPKEGEVILKPNISHSSFGNTPYWWMVRPGQVDWPHPPEL